MLNGLKYSLELKNNIVRNEGNRAGIAWTTKKNLHKKISTKKIFTKEFCTQTCTPHLVGGAAVAIAGVDLHGRDVPLGGALDQLRKARGVAVERPERGTVRE